MIPDCRTKRDHIESVIELQSNNWAEPCKNLSSYLEFIRSSTKVGVEPRDLELILIGRPRNPVPECSYIGLNDVLFILYSVVER